MQYKKDSLGLIFNCTIEPWVLQVSTFLRLSKHMIIKVKYNNLLNFHSKKDLHFIPEYSGERFRSSQQSKMLQKRQGF